MTRPDPTQFITWPNGGNAVVDRRTAAALHVAEHRLGYPLSVIKGHDVAAPGTVSSTTHNGTGAADLPPFDWQRKRRVLEDVGFIVYHRTPADGFPEHLHIVLRGKQHGLDPLAQAQVEDWLAMRNGLASHGPDRDTYRPDPIPPTFSYAKWWHTEQVKVTGLSNRVKAINERIAALKTRRAFLKAKLIATRHDMHA